MAATEDIKVGEDSLRAWTKGEVGKGLYKISFYVPDDVGVEHEKVLPFMVRQNNIPGHYRVFNARHVTSASKANEEKKSGYRFVVGVDEPFLDRVLGLHKVLYLVLFKIPIQTTGVETILSEPAKPPKAKPVKKTDIPPPKMPTNQEWVLLTKNGRQRLAKRLLAHGMTPPSLTAVEFANVKLDLINAAKAKGPTTSEAKNPESVEPKEPEVQVVAVKASPATAVNKDTTEKSAVTESGKAGEAETVKDLSPRAKKKAELDAMTGEEFRQWQLECAKYEKWKEAQKPKSKVSAKQTNKKPAKTKADASGAKAPSKSAPPSKIDDKDTSETEIDKAGTKPIRSYFSSNSAGPKKTK